MPIKSREDYARRWTDARQGHDQDDALALRVELARQSFEPDESALLPWPQAEDFSTLLAGGSCSLDFELTAQVGVRVRAKSWRVAVRGRGCFCGQDRAF